jgi:hypothetical protein
VHSPKCTETRWVDTLYVRILESRTKSPLGEVLMWEVLSQDWKAGSLNLIDLMPLFPNYFEWAFASSG